MAFLSGHQRTGITYSFSFTYDLLLGLTVESTTVIDFEGLLYKHWWSTATSGLKVMSGSSTLNNWKFYLKESKTLHSYVWTYDLAVLWLPSQLLLSFHFESWTEKIFILFLLAAISVCLCLSVSPSPACILSKIIILSECLDSFFINYHSSSQTWINHCPPKRNNVTDDPVKL